MPIPADREALAVAEMASTRIRRGTASGLAGVFLALLCAGAVAQLSWEPPREPGEHPFHLKLPGISDLVAAAGERGWRGPARELRDAITAIDDWAQKQSSLARLVHPPTQLFLVNALQFGNAETRVGRDGWLFFEPDLADIAAPPFLDPGRLAERQRFVPDPDPLPAVLALGRDLAARGVGFLVLPIPSKVVADPRPLLATAAPVEALRNPSFDEFVRRLDDAGIRVFDPSSLLRSFALTGEPQYLRRDTHWRAVAADHVAEALASEIGRHWEIPRRPDLKLHRTSESIYWRPDLRRTLGLPVARGPDSLEEVPVEVVREANGAIFDPRRDDAPVLLFGDSFAGIYSHDFGRFGRGAGLADELSFYLETSVDSIVVVAGTETSSREELVRRLETGREKLGQKKLLIYEFVVRDLSGGNWPVVRLPSAAPR